MTTIEKIIEGKCPACLEETKLKYLREQETLDKGVFLYLYNCEKCGSTASLGEIEKINKKCD